MSLYRVELMDGVETVRAMLREPLDRKRDVNPAIEQLGGRLRDAWVTLDDFNVMAIIELGGDVAANALWQVFKAGAAVDQVRIQSIISINDHVEGLKQAQAVDYTPPQGVTWDRNLPGKRADFKRVGARELTKGNLYIVEVMDCNPDSIRAMVRDPHDRTPAVASVVEQLGGRLHQAWITLAAYDAFMIVELPDDIAASALWSVFKAGEGVVRVRMQTVISLEDHVTALHRAAGVDYTPPQGATWEQPVNYTNK